MSDPDAEPTGYLAWSRDPAVGLFAVLPLWLAYEGLRLCLAPEERNGAEALLAEVLRLLGPTAFTILRLMFGIAVLLSALSLLRRSVPWLKVTLVTALEGLVYALVLGPLAGGLEASSARLLGAVPQNQLLRDLVGSLGAGLFEELVFRLILLSVLALAFTRVAQSFGFHKVFGVAGAVLVSAVVFSLFHHVGPGAAPFDQREFVFRAIAGLILGVMFVVRGFGVTVYAHALYDVHYYLTT